MTNEEVIRKAAREHVVYLREIADHIEIALLDSGKQLQPPERLEKLVVAFDNGEWKAPNTETAIAAKRVISPDARRKMAAAQRKRWAAIRKAK